MGKFHVFLSCEDEVLVNNESIELFLNKIAPQGCTIKCIKHKNIKISKEDLDDLKESSIYVVDTHKQFDNITYWELGYAMGKGIEIIGYYDGKNIKKIPSDVEELITIPHDITRFLEKLNRALSELKPKEYPLIEDWDKQYKPSKKEAGAI